jgi:hypothetical protein
MNGTMSTVIFLERMTTISMPVDLREQYVSSASGQISSQ